MARLDCINNKYAIILIIKVEIYEARETKGE